jgi:hypothetical protein
MEQLVPLLSRRRPAANGPLGMRRTASKSEERPTLSKTERVGHPRSHSRMRHPPVQGNDLGQAIGHIGALVQGMFEMVQGGTAALAGGTEALVTAPAAATGVGTVIPGAGVGVAILGVAEAAHGAAVFGNTLSNIHAASEHKKGARPSTEEKHTGKHSSRTGDKLRKDPGWQPKKGAGGRRSPGSWRDKEGE